VSLDTNGHLEVEGSSLPAEQAQTPQQRQEAIEQKDKKVVERFLSFLKEKNLGNKPNRKESVTADATEHQKILSTVQQDLQVMSKIVKTTQVEMMTQIQQVNAAEAYNKRSRSTKRSRRTFEMDQDFGCLETFLQDEPTPPAKPLKSAAVKQEIIQTAQETAIIREISRRLRKQARELCQRRVRTKNIPNQAF
jgi:transposase-like protein